MNLNNLIKKIIHIDLEKNHNTIVKSFLIKSMVLFFVIPLLLTLYNKIPTLESFFLSFGVYLSFFASYILFHGAYYNKKNKINKFIFRNNIKIFKSNLTKEELDIINEHTMSIFFMFADNDQTSLLDYLIKKNITTLDHNNLEEFLNILNKNNLIEKYLPILVKKIEKYEDLIKIIYPLESQNLTINTTKEILIMSKFLNDNPTLKTCIIDTLYANIFLENIKENSNFLNQLSSEQIVNKILEQYTLKELTHSLFHKSSFNNTYFKLEISNIINLLNIENKDLFIKAVIEKVLKENILTTVNTLEFCNIEFLKFAEYLNIENKQELYLLKSKFPEEKLVSNDNLRIIHI